MSKIFIQPVIENFDEFLVYAKENGYNLEIASFADSEVLDSVSDDLDWKVLLEDYKSKLKGFKGLVSVHGCFHDLVTGSRDMRVRQVARDRILQNLEIAEELNAAFAVFHGGYNPMIRNPSYRQKWADRQAEFWRDILPKFKSTVVLENLWEPRPEIFKELFSKAGSSNLKVCFDVGHANVFSEVPLNKWFEVLREEIVYIHVNDNEGKVDTESVVGCGNIDWKNFSSAIEARNMEPFVVMEVGSLQDTIESINYLRDNNIYPLS